MTPEEARDLLEGATPGPWEVETVPEMRYYDGETWETPGKIVVYADEATLFVAADEFVGDEGDEHDNEKNVRLAAAAPDLAAVIAGMRAEYRTEEWQGMYPGWVPTSPWTAEKPVGGADPHTRVVRRYVAEQEVIA